MGDSAKDSNSFLRNLAIQSAAAILSAVFSIGGLTLVYTIYHDKIIDDALTIATTRKTQSEIDYNATKNKRETLQYINETAPAPSFDLTICRLGYYSLGNDEKLIIGFSRKITNDSRTPIEILAVHTSYSYSITEYNTYKQKCTVVWPGDGLKWHTIKTDYYSTPEFPPLMVTLSIPPWMREGKPLPYIEDGIQYFSRVLDKSISSTSTFNAVIHMKNHQLLICKTDATVVYRVTNDSGENQIRTAQKSVCSYFAAGKKANNVNTAEIKDPAI